MSLQDTQGGGGLLLMSGTRHCNPSNIFARVIGLNASRDLISKDIPQFSKPRMLRKYLKDNKHNSLHLVQKYARILVVGHYLFQEALRNR